MKDSTAIIIVIGLGLMLFLGGSLVAGFGTVITDILDSVGDFIKHGFGGGGQSQTQLGWTFEYVDGTTEEVTPNQTLPLLVLKDGKAINYFGVTTWMKLEYGADPYYIQGSVDLKLYIDNVLHSKHTQPIEQQKAPTEGEWTQIFGATISWGAHVIEEKDAGKFTTHTVKGTATVTLTIVFSAESGVPNIDLVGTAQGSMTLEVKQSATMDVEVKAVTVSHSVYQLS